MLENINKIIEATNGLEISFKVGQESELIIKGDFLKMAKLVASLADASDKDNKKVRKIADLQNEIKELQS